MARRWFDDPRLPNTPRSSNARLFSQITLLHLSLISLIQFLLFSIYFPRAARKFVFYNRFEMDYRWYVTFNSFFPLFSSRFVFLEWKKGKSFTRKKKLETRFHRIFVFPLSKIHFTHGQRSIDCTYTYFTSSAITLSNSRLERLVQTNAEQFAFPSLQSAPCPVKFTFPFYPPTHNRATNR